MDSEILDAVTEWGARPVSDGVAGLYDLADEEFSGAVTDGTAWTFVLNGRYLGVFDGDVHDFEDASLTAYTAPDVSLPLLYAMRARGGQTRGQYYSNETPLTEIDETLSSGNFVGYVELSENVLSGDYYVVYYGGRSLPVAYVGNSRRLLTGDEAFERAADEVGIYSVVDADVDIVELPEPDPRETDDAGAGAGAGGAAGAAATTTDAAGADAPADAADDVAFDDVDTGDGTTPAGTGPDDAADGAFADATTDHRSADADAADEADTDAPTPDWATPEVATDDADDEATGEETAAGVDTNADAAPEDEETDAEADANADAAPEGGTSAAADGADEPAADDAASAMDAGTVTTEDVALEPATNEEAGDPTDGDGTADEAADADATGDGATDAEPTGADEATDADATDDGTADGVTADQVARLRHELEAVREAKSEVEAERDRIASERDEHRAAVERLQERVAELEAEIERLEDDDAAAVATDRTLTPAEALAGTNLFVRYEDKTAGTLERAAQGRIDASTLRDNLRIDHHTEFETEGLAVDGRPFEAFLRGTTEHRFVEWLLTALTYEIRQTDTRAGLSKLYEAIERIDRIDLGGEVDVSAETRPEATSESFDVVFRDKMGDPLFVAAIEDDRDPTTASAVEELIESASRVSETATTLAGAFFVSTSFFESAAMKAVVDATRGGLFSRSSRRSYVKLSRKSGFHLCLVEARDDDLFLTVPDL
ncbi:DUF7527 domain-containing protein [Haloplanus salinarum]|uniref:DUF7527 domain-containing protein n=1 Tax=Haloplanus salinarum TaxID=1912324 RepID=UPI00214B409C|nr:hypothetical protein [Haloplanus salinarum]